MYPFFVVVVHRTEYVHLVYVGFSGNTERYVYMCQWTDRGLSLISDRWPRKALIMEDRNDYCPSSLGMSKTRYLPISNCRRLLDYTAETHNINRCE